MSVESHVQSLRQKHEHLSVLVEQEQRNPASDDLRLAELKRQKMRLKEEIERFGRA